MLFFFIFLAQTNSRITREQGTETIFFRTSGPFHWNEQKRLFLACNKFKSWKIINLEKKNTLDFCSLYLQNLENDFLVVKLYLHRVDCSMCTTQSSSQDTCDFTWLKNSDLKFVLINTRCVEFTASVQFREHQVSSQSQPTILHFGDLSPQSALLKTRRCCSLNQTRTII